LSGTLEIEAETRQMRLESERLKQENEQRMRELDQDNERLDRIIGSPRICVIIVQMANIWRK
jgi:hypothetical protein